MDEIKSLQRKLEETVSGAERLPILLSLGTMLRQVHLDNSIAYAREAEELAAKLGDERSLGRVYILQAMQLDRHNKRPEIFELLEKGKDLFEKNNDQLGLGHAYNNEGWVHLAHSDFDAAANFFDRALAIYRRENSLVDIAVSLSNLSIPCKTRGDYNQSLFHLNACTDILQTIHEPKLFTSVKANKAVVYFHMEMYQQSLEIFLDCMDVYEKTHNRPYYANTLLSVANCYEQMNDYPNNLKYLHRAIKAYSALGDNGSVARVYNDLGNTLTTMGGHDEAFTYFNKALRLLEAEKNYGEIYGYVSYCLGRYWVEKKDFIVSEEYLLKGLSVGKEKGIPNLVNISCVKLSELYTAIGTPDKAKFYNERRDANQMVA